MRLSRGFGCSRECDPDVIARLALCLRYAVQVAPAPRPEADYLEWRAYAERVLTEAATRGLRVLRSDVSP